MFAKCKLYISMFLSMFTKENFAQGKKKQGCIATEKYLCSKGQSNGPLMEKGYF